MPGDLNTNDVKNLISRLKEKNLRINKKKVISRLSRIVDSQKVFPLEQQRALLVRLITMYEESQRTEVILIEELGADSFPVTFAIGALAEDWPGMTNSILGIVHHYTQNIDFLKGFTVKYPDTTIGLVILAFRIETLEEYHSFKNEKRALLSRIREASVGSASKFVLLEDEAVKFEIYNDLVNLIKKQYSGTDIEKLIGEKGEALYFVSSRSREYLEERSVRDIASLIVDNFKFQESVRKGQAQEMIKIRNFQTRYEKLTGITFVCREKLISVEDFLRSLNFIVPGYILKHHKSFVTHDGILVYRIEVVDRYMKPLKKAVIDSIEKSLSKLINASYSKEFSQIKSIGGFEHYARAIIPFLMMEMKRTGLTQVFINADKRTDFAVAIKLVIVSPVREGNHLFKLLKILETVDGVEVISALPPKKYSQNVEVGILKLQVAFSEFSSIREIFSAVKEKIQSVFGAIRDFDQGFREIDMGVLRDLFSVLKNVNPGLVRDIFFNFDELYRIEIPFNLMADLIMLCSRAIEQSARKSGKKMVFKYRHLTVLKKTICVISFAEPVNLKSLLVDRLADLKFYFSKIEWDQRVYYLLVMSKDGKSLPTARIREFKDKLTDLCSG